jgi:hypothetical protein
MFVWLPAVDSSTGAAQLNGAACGRDAQFAVVQQKFG